MLFWLILAISLCVLVSVLLWRVHQLSLQIDRLQKENAILKKRGSEFVANVSHELKTPLTSIKGYSETLREVITKDPQRAIEFLSRIDDNAERLSWLIHDILELSRLESPAFQHRSELFKVDPVLKDLKEQFSLKLAGKEQTLLIRNEVENLQADKRMFEQALSNLIENAHRYSGKGAVIEITGTITSDNNRLFAEFSVYDNGPGINPDDLPRIFERFYRAEKSRTRLSGGTGLGLAIVKHIMNSHSGSVRVQSEPQRGAQFTLSFPIG